MDVRELRIGNLIEYKGKAAPIVRIDSLNELKERGYTGSVTIAEYDDDGRTIWNYNAPWLAQIKPIELSEEWLLKAGFEIDNKSAFSLGHEKPFKVYRKGLFTYNGIQSAWWYNGQVLQKQPEYVHKLQNLFFELEGTELIFNHG